MLYASKSLGNVTSSLWAVTLQSRSCFDGDRSVCVLTVVVTAFDEAPLLHNTLYALGLQATQVDDDLEVVTEESQLVVRGRQSDDTEREYLHRGIAARQFQRTFVLADGMRVLAAELKNGLLSIDLDRPEPERLVRKINISVKD